MIRISAKYSGVREITPTWWALGPMGGSIRRKPDGFYWYPNTDYRPRELRHNEIRRYGPFRSLNEAVREATKVVVLN